MTRIWQWLIVVVLAATGCHQRTISIAECAAERQKMVEEQLKPRGIHDERVLAAMAKVPREEFVPQNMRAQSYADSALPIGHDQTISQPFIVAYMTEQLRLQPTDRALEIGTGSGSSAAGLSDLVQQVYTIKLSYQVAN